MYEANTLRHTYKIKQNICVLKSSKHTQSPVLSYLTLKSTPTRQIWVYSRNEFSLFKTYTHQCRLHIRIVHLSLMTKSSAKSSRRWSARSKNSTKRHVQTNAMRINFMWVMYYEIRADRFWNAFRCFNHRTFEWHVLYWNATTLGPLSAMPCQKLFANYSPRIGSLETALKTFTMLLMHSVVPVNSLSFK